MRGLVNETSPAEVRNLLSYTGVFGSRETEPIGYLDIDIFGGVMKEGLGVWD